MPGLLEMIALTEHLQQVTPGSYCSGFRCND
jgi:hypothetical protein